ncbi:MAG: hypothetical protein ACSHX4_03790 [Opitutaceae bacterium]
MKLNSELASKLTKLTIFVVYDRAETAVRLKNTLDRANAEFDQLFEFDLRLWRLDILELPGCWADALKDLEDADLLTMVFSCHGQSVFSPELNYMVEKWNKRNHGQNCTIFAQRSAPYCSEVSAESLRAFAQQRGTEFSSTAKTGTSN